MGSLKVTPDGRIRSHLRKLWMTSRERSSALKREGYCCERCGVKQSRAKGREVAVEVHHSNRITNWQEIIAVVRENLLTSPDNLEVLCKQCHKEHHENEKKQEKQNVV